MTATKQSNARHRRPLVLAVVVTVSALVVGCGGVTSDGLTGRGAGTSGSSSSGTGGLIGTGGTGGNVAASGGGIGEGGSFETGGTRGGAGGAGGAKTGCAVCAATEKCCQSPNGGTPVCVERAPQFGCSLTTCSPCVVPANGIAVCNGESCGIQCNPGYDPTSMGACVQPGAGGAGGDDGGFGAGGTPPSLCSPTLCPKCTSPIGTLPCCRNNNTCGCAWTPGAFCY